MGRVRNKDQIQLAELLTSIAREVRHDNSLNADQRQEREWQLIYQRYPTPYSIRDGLGDDGEEFILYADHEEAIAEIAEDISRSFDKAVSPSYLKELLMHIVRDAANNEEIGAIELKQRLSNLIDTTRNEIKACCATIPIVGLRLEPAAASVKIGPVTFKSAGLDYFRNISPSYFGLPVLDENFRHVNAAGEVDVLAADPEATREQAEFKVLLALDILRIIFYRHRWLLAGGLTLDLVGGLPQRVVFYKKTEQGEQEYRLSAWGVNPGRTSVLGAPLEITELHRAIIRDSGFTDFDGLFERDTGKVIGRLQRSIRWCSEATLEVDTARSFLKQAIAVEALLGGGSGPIAESIAKRVAFLVSNDMQKRIEARDKVKELYNKYRPKIAHGSSIMPPLKELHEFQAYVVTSIIRYANLFRKQTTWKEVEDWFDKQKFT